MSSSRYSTKALNAKFAEWRLLTPQNTFAMMSSNDFETMMQIMGELVETHSDVVLNQYEFNLIIKHTNIVGIQKVLLELKKANVTLDQNDLKGILTLNSERLNSLILLLKSANMFHNQVNLNIFLQSNIQFSSKQLISSFTNPKFLFPEQAIDEAMYKDFFAQLESSIAEANIEDVSDALFELIVTNQSQSKGKIELLLLVENDIDKDLTDVIKMRQQVCQEKGNALMVMPEKVFRAIIETGVIVSGVSKLSFLHHHVRDAVLESLMDLSYTAYMGNYTKQMPDLKDIVLRSCSTVEPDFDNYKLKILKSHQDIASIQVQAKTLLILQKEKDGIVTTHVKYKKNTSKDPITKTFKNIHDLSPEALEKISKCCGVTLGHTLSMKKDPKLIEKFLNGKPMNNEELHLVKQMFVRARTELRNDFGNKPSMASYVMRVLIEAGYHGTLKGYIKGYQAVGNRVVPVHGVDGIDAFPKATKVKIAANTPDKKVHSTFECSSGALMMLTQHPQYALFKPIENSCRIVSKASHVRYIRPQLAITMESQTIEASSDRRLVVASGKKWSVTSRL